MRQRGALELEMLLARLLGEPDRPQIVAFTSRASAGDAKRMAACSDDVKFMELKIAS